MCRTPVTGQPSPSGNRIVNQQPRGDQPQPTSNNPMLAGHQVSQGTPTGLPPAPGHDPLVTQIRLDQSSGTAATRDGMPPVGLTVLPPGTPLPSNVLTITVTNPRTTPPGATFLAPSPRTTAATTTTTTSSTASPISPDPLPPLRSRGMALGVLGQAVPSGRMMTEAELIAEKGKAPSLFGSRLYKEVIAARNEYEKALAKTRVGPARQGAVKDIEARLNALEKTIDNYCVKHRNDPAMQKLKGQIPDERKLLHIASRNPGFAVAELNNGHGYSFQQAIELQRLGIAPGPMVTFDEEHTDRRIKKSNEKFASGAINTVAHVVYRDNKEKILKPEPETAGGAMIDNAIGIPSERPRYGNRNIATCVLDKFLGTGLTPKTEYAVHNGRVYLIMDLAPGVSGNGKAEKVALGKEAPQHEMVTAEINRQTKKKGTVLTDQDQRNIAKLQGVDIEFHHGTFTLYETRHRPYAIDYNNAQLAKAMCNAELLDYIAFQGDRHPGNYIIDMHPDGSFKGMKLIDGDASFGTLADPEKVWSMRKGTIESKHYNGVGMPLLFDKASVDKLTAPWAWDQIRQDLSGLLTPKEIEAAKERFDAVVEHVKNPMNARRIITDWTVPTVPARNAASASDLVTPAQYLLTTPEKSYLGRDHQILQEKMAKSVVPQKLPQ